MEQIIGRHKQVECKLGQTFALIEMEKSLMRLLFCLSNCGIVQSRIMHFRTGGIMRKHSATNNASTLARLQPSNMPYEVQYNFVTFMCGKVQYIKTTK